MIIIYTCSYVSTVHVLLPLQLELLGNDVPQLRELYRHIVPVYASVWKDLGLELEIPMYTLNAIAVDHASHPSSSTECCKAMLQKWIRMSPRPTWARLEEALGHLPEPLHPGCKSKFQNRHCVTRWKFSWKFVLFARDCIVFERQLKLNVLIVRHFVLVNYCTIVC